MTRPPNPVSFCRETCGILLRHLMRGQSLTLTGVGSSGKSNVALHLERRDVIEYHLGPRARGVAGVRVDFLQYAQADVVGIHSALVNALTHAAARADAPPELAGCRADLLILRRQTAEATSPNASNIYVSDALALVFAAGMQHIFFFLDEFDRTLQNAPAAGLRSLRGFRDMHKGRLAYVAAMRKEMAHVRPNTQEYEDFYELACKPVIALGVYGWEDASFMMQVLAAGEGTLTPAQQDGVLRLSGGHPGLIRLLYDVAAAGNLDIYDPLACRQLIRRPAVVVECGRIWDSLDGDEQKATMMLAAGAQDDKQHAAQQQVVERLKRKTLAKEQGGQSMLFSPVFSEYVKANRLGMPAAELARASFDQDACLFVLDGRRFEQLDEIEYALLHALWEKRNQPMSENELTEIAFKHWRKGCKRCSSPDDRRKAYMLDLSERINQPERLYIRADDDGSYTFIEMQTDAG